MNARPATDADYRPDVAPVPVPVHVASIGAELAAAMAPGSPPAPAAVRRAVYHTVTLTAVEGAQPVLNASNDREIAWVTAIDADVVLSDSLADAKSSNGAYLPCVTPAAGKPNLGGPFPVEDNGPVFAGVATALAGTATARISVVAVYRAR